MKNLVITTNIKPENGKIPDKPTTFSYTPSIFNVCVESTQKWAQRMGANFLEVTDDHYFPGWSPTWQRMLMFLDEYKDYDQIMYCDGDYGVHDLTPNLLSWTSKQPETFFAVGDLTNKLHKTVDKHFNAGFYVIKKEAINTLRPYYREFMNKHTKSRYQDQDCLNDLLNVHKVSFRELSRNWNGLFAVKRPLFCIHYVSIRKMDFSFEEHTKQMERKMNILSQMSEEEILNLY